jgi:hypothetical protein
MKKETAERNTAVLHLEHIKEGNIQLDAISSRLPKYRTLQITQAMFFLK